MQTITKEVGSKIGIIIPETVAALEALAALLVLFELAVVFGIRVAVAVVHVLKPEQKFEGVFAQAPVI